MVDQQYINHLLFFPLYNYARSSKAKLEYSLTKSYNPLTNRYNDDVYIYTRHNCI